jgi:uncharacterized membrane protein (DUF373 family)
MGWIGAQGRHKLDPCTAIDRMIDEIALPDNAPVGARRAGGVAKGDAAGRALPLRGIWALRGPAARNAVMSRNPPIGAIGQHMPEPYRELPRTMAFGSNSVAKGRVLLIYRRFLDLIVTALVFVMVLTLLGAVVGLVLDFGAAVMEFRGDLYSHNLAHGVVDGLDRELVIDVLSVFVLIELFRTFTDYLEFHRVRLRVLSEVGIAFILREIFIGLYDHRIQWPEILALAALLAVLVTARIAAVHFEVRDGTAEQQ